MSEMKPRITGTEMEWAVFTRRKKQIRYEKAPDKHVTQVINGLDSSIKRESDVGMLSNGGRYYADCEHPEYATPEDTSFLGTVANELAGENIVYDSMVAAQNTEQKGGFDAFVLNKRVVDDDLNTWGHHISLSARADSLEIDEHSLTPLGKHLATINIYCGAGAVIPHKTGSTKFTVAQKSLNLNTDFNSSSHTSIKPLISTRNDPLADKDLYTRVHVTSLDANMSPWATWMKIGTISIVVRMMEHGYLSQERYFSVPMNQVALAVARDPDFIYKAELVDGRTIKPLDIQINLAQRADKFKKDYGLPEEEERVLSEWKRVLADLEADPRRTADRVEWVLRREILRQYMARHALRLGDAPVLNLDRRWSDIGPDSIGARLRKSRWSQWMPSEESVYRAYHYPPTTTRAFGRAALVYKYAENGGHHFSASWEYARYKNKAWSMGDPYVRQVDPEHTRSTDPILIGPDHHHEDDYEDIIED